MWDVFISHASEDKEPVARPLAEELGRRGLRVWYDERSLSLGDNWPNAIEDGLAHSRFGVVILSKSFFVKDWPRRELDRLLSREMFRQKVILPILHDVSLQEVERYIPILVGRVMITTQEGIEALADAIERVVTDVVNVPGRSSNKQHESTAATANAAADIKSKTLRSFAGEVQSIVVSATVPRLFILTLQGILISFIAYSHALLFGIIFGTMAPLWVFPLGGFVVKFITRDVILTFLMGGLLGGVIGVYVCGLIFEWGFTLGGFIGGFYVAAAATYFLVPTKPVRIIWACIASSVLIACLGVFNDIDFYLRPNEDTLVGTLVSSISWIVFSRIIYLHRIALKA